MKHLFSQITIIILLVSCGSSSSEKQMTSSKDASPKNPSSSCLNKYIDDPCTMFTFEKIAEIVDIDLSKVEIEEPLKFDFMKKTSCYYKWNSGRMSQVKTAIGMIDVDVDNNITIGQFNVLDKEKIKTSYTEWFDGYYDALTPEEIESYEKMYQDRLAKENEEVQKAGGSIKKLLSKSKVVKVEGVGDRAVVETLGKNADVTLKVLHRNTVFIISANINDDQDVNLDVAKKVAQAVIQLCE